MTTCSTTKSIYGADPRINQGLYNRGNRHHVKHSALPIGCIGSGRGGCPTYPFINVHCCKGRCYGIQWLPYPTSHLHPTSILLRYNP
eukprot:4554364-Pleurochrysis_carterae.AAC.1